MVAKEGVWVVRIPRPEVDMVAKNALESELKTLDEGLRIMGATGTPARPCPRPPSRRGTDATHQVSSCPTVPPPPPPPSPAEAPGDRG